MWLHRSDEEQEEAGERGERCEVWKERVRGRVVLWSEENEEPEVHEENKRKRKRESVKKASRERGECERRVRKESEEKRAGGERDGSRKDCR